MPQITIGLSRLARLYFGPIGVVAIAFVAASFLLSSSQRPQLVAILFAGVFGGFGLVAAIAPTQGMRSRLTLTPAGISGSALGGRLIPWQDVRNASVGRRLGEPYLSLRLDPAGPYADLVRLRFPFRARSKTSGNVSINFLMLDMPVATVATIINDTVRTAGAA